MTFRVVTTESVLLSIRGIADCPLCEGQAEDLRDLVAHRDHLQHQVKDLQERNTLLVASRRLIKAEQEGLRAHLDGRSTNDCPYWGDEPMQAAWIAGWSEANEALPEIT